MAAGINAFLSRMFVKKVPGDEELLYVVGATNCTHTTAFTDKAVYFGAHNGRLDLSRSRRVPWGDVEGIVIKTPVWAVFLSSVGFRIVLKNGQSRFFIDGGMRRLLRFAARYGWPVVHAGRLWDKPGVCEVRQAAVFLGVLSLLMMLVFML